ncbi:hypothetical protein Tco_0100245, partial [Tanacetum coccineum]
MSLSAEVRMRVEYNVKERRRLKYIVEEHDEMLKTRNVEIEGLKSQLLLKEAEAAEAIRLQFEVSVVGKERELTDLNAQRTSVKSQNDNLIDRVHENLSAYENLTERLEEFQEAQLKTVNDKLEKLDVDLAEMACHLEEKFYPHLLTTIFGRRWLLTYGLKLVLVKCLNSYEYLTALGAAIRRAIEKGMQDGLATRINHCREGRNLTDVAAYNPSAEPNYHSALQEFREVDFSLLAKLKSH